MPPCGNFGLLLLGKNDFDAERRALPPQSRDQRDANAIQRETMRAVSETGGLVLAQDLPSHLYLNDDDGGGGGGGGGGGSEKASTSWKSPPGSPVGKGKKGLASHTHTKRQFHYVQPDLHTPLKILESMTAMTEIRGGQAGGYSVIEHTEKEALQRGEIPHPQVHRVRAVARKRVPLAADLTLKYLQETGHHNPVSTTPSLTCIGHTRFATSSVNVVPELHPHEWSPWKFEEVWRLNPISGVWSLEPCLCGIHITHDGDFDALESYSNKLTNGEVGHWLERVLHVKNETRGDSPKVAGMMDLLRVQGRWGPAARLAWVRCVNIGATDVTGGMQLGKEAGNVFPSPEFFDKWATLLNAVWLRMMYSVVEIHSPDAEARAKHHTYTINLKEEREFVHALVAALESDDESLVKPLAQPSSFNFFRASGGGGGGGGSSGGGGGGDGDSIDGSVHSQDSFQHDVEMGGRNKPGGGSAAIRPGLRRLLKADKWTRSTMVNFFTSCVRGFLRSDTYTSLCEFLSRAEGSFGLQVHSPLEPGVVVIASKGQPMSMAFDPVLPLCLFGSEAGALGVPVDKGGRWLSRRIDLDNQGEVIRVGEPRTLNDGSFVGLSPADTRASDGAAPDCLMLQCGIQIKSYCLETSCEARLPELLSRIIHVNSTVKVFDPNVDLIGNDLDATPAVLATIDRTWGVANSFEREAASSFSQALHDCMRERLRKSDESTDLVISGVEASLWLAESFASDLRTVFPQINIVTLSSNKLLGLGLPRCATVFFPGSIVVEEKMLSDKTCFLLISQSGQTFPTLHGSVSSARFLRGQRLWLMTATFNSRCEKVIKDDHLANGKRYHNDRVFNICCGHRPAEPSSVVVAATWHSLSRLMLYLIKHMQEHSAEGCFVHKWDNTRPETKEEITDTRPPVVTTLSRGCVEDIESLFNDYLVSNVAEIVGVAAVPNLKGEVTIYESLVEQGRAWGEHIREPWTVLVLVGGYLFISVGLGLPLFGLLGDAVVAIVRAAGVDLGQVGTTTLSFSPRNVSAIVSQHWAWTVAGFLLQIVDAAWFVYLAKNFTRLSRLVSGRPMWSRFGKRTIVIVDTPTNHQLLESFVSKLFSQSYSHTSVDVHGASGLDHFVHRYTHRVVRGVLLAAGRCDGRMGCLAKSELATLLSLKQAAFITNPEYKDDDVFNGSGPEIVTIGHNPYKSSLGLAHQICIESRLKRRPFMEEYLFERLHLAAKPFTAILLKSLRDQYLVNQQNRNEEREWRGQKKLPYGSHHIGPQTGKGGSLLLQFMQQAKDQMNRRKSTVLRVGTGRDNNDIIKMLTRTFENYTGASFRESLSGKLAGVLSPLSLSHKSHQVSPAAAKSRARRPNMPAAARAAPAALPDIKPSNDPSAREAFSLRFDSNAQAVQDAEMTVEHIYESRIAALERYMSFCVMFHAMADHCRKPWLLMPWDMARSQSNLRIATTASPIAVIEGAHKEVTVKAKKDARMVAAALRGSSTYF